jgi:perosamine synthetase
MTCDAQMTLPKLTVPFFRPEISDEAIEEVIGTLRSGWLTSGPKVHLFEQMFAEAVGATHAVAVNSCTAALHLAVEALGLKQGQAVLVPTMTFAATAEVIRYQGAIPILVDCDPATSHIDLDDAARKLEQLQSGKLPKAVPGNLEVVGIIPVHVGGLMLDLARLREFASTFKLWVVEDAAHAFPAAWKDVASETWQRCGEGTAEVTCFSFYANKSITTGEGGMAVTEDANLAERIRLMSNHGLSHSAWERCAGENSWDYKIIAPGYKYNLTDIAAALGIHQLAQAEEMRRKRAAVARYYMEALAGVAEITLPPDDEQHRLHAWHLFPIKLNLERLSIRRHEFLELLREAGIGCSVHWRPLHLHPYYQETFGWQPKSFPVATSVWERLISLPIFPGLRQEEAEHVVQTIRNVCANYAR